MVKRKQKIIEIFKRSKLGKRSVIQDVDNY